MTLTLRKTAILTISMLMLLAFAGSANAQQRCNTSADCGADGICSVFGVCMQPEERPFQPAAPDNGTGEPEASSPTPGTVQNSPSPASPGQVGPVSGPGAAPAGPVPGPGNIGVSQSGTGETLVNPLKVNNVEDLLNLILEAVIQIGVIVLVLALIWTGFLFIKAQGKPEELAKARQAFIWTIIGGLILLGAKGISEVIQATATNL